MWAQKTKLDGRLSERQKFLYFSSWPLGLTCAAGGIEAGIIWAFVFHNINVDGGVAAIVAAFISLGGVIWVAQFAALRKDDPFAEFIGEGAAVVWREADRLGTLCTVSESKEPAAYPNLLRQQVISVLGRVS